MTYDGRAISNFILDFAASEGMELSNLALQKVLFFCHAGNLVENGRPLVKHEFEAWQHGPVLQYIYSQFKDFEKLPIRGRAMAMNAMTGEKEVAHADIDESTANLIKKTVRFYGKLEPWDLVDLSHAKDGPWYRVWNHSGRVNPGMKIPNDLIVSFYSKLDVGSTVQ